ncbi:MAG: hypothetical protein GY775_17360 [Candidatus Scalindua sp.]|nr:hypothetical protein [Candidatus Scalindua sp.]
MKKILLSVVVMMVLSGCALIENEYNGEYVLKEVTGENTRTDHKLIIGQFVGTYTKAYVVDELLTDVDVFLLSSYDNENYDSEDISIKILGFTDNFLEVKIESKVYLLEEV